MASTNSFRKSNQKKGKWKTLSVLLTQLTLTLKKRGYYGKEKNHVGTEHILLGLLRESKGIAAIVLVNMGLSLETARKEVSNILSKEKVIDT